ncbi:3D domain-containing protein [Clostridium cibarium]|nr:3D domain-containing protein [Clostridium cibarium]
MKKITSIILAFMLLIINIPFTAKATSFTANDANNAQLNVVSDKLKQLDTDLAKTQKEVAELKETVSNNENSIKTTQKEIDNTQEKINSLNEDIKKNEEILDERLREMYKSGSYSEFNYLSFIFKSKSLTDFFNKVNSCRIIINQDKKLIEGIREKVNEQNKAMDSITKQKENLVALTEENKKKLEEVKSKEDSLSETKAKLAQEKANLKDAIRKNEAQFIAKYIEIINSDSSDYSALSYAAIFLKGFLDQVSTPSVKDEAKASIAKAEEKMKKLTPSPNSNSGFSGSPSSYRQSYTMEATAYTANTSTATGTIPVRNPNGLSTVAVDPSIIPLGSTVYVSGYGYAIAADTGGDIHGMRIDLFMNSEADCIAFGRKDVTVLLIN